MKIKKYCAANSQLAMRMIREEQGPDAIILSCRQVPEGVEFAVSVEPDELAQAQPDPAPQASQPPRKRTDRPPSGDAPAASAPRHFSGEPPQVVWSQDAELLSLKQELHSMRSMLEFHLRDNTWRDIGQGRPGRAPALELLAAMDIDPIVGEQLARDIPEGESAEVQREVLRSLLIRQLPVAPPITAGGLALVGPPGSGKTTTIAKIAAQHVMSRGRDGITLLTTDNARVAAQEQLRVYGRILQIPVHVATRPEEIVKSYRLLRRKQLVLVDTAGMSFRDGHGLETLRGVIAALPDIRTLLTLPADTEPHALHQIADAYCRLRIDGAVLTRLDEAMCLGRALSLLIQRRIPAVWFTNGPRVPRHLYTAEAGKLVAMAIRMARDVKAAPDERAARSRPPAGGLINAQS